MLPVSSLADRHRPLVSFCLPCNPLPCSAHLGCAPQVEKEVAKASSLMEGVEGEIGRKKEVSRRVSPSGTARYIWPLFFSASAPFPLAAPPSSEPSSPCRPTYPAGQGAEQRDCGGGARGAAAGGAAPAPEAAAGGAAGGEGLLAMLESEVTLLSCTPPAGRVT